MIDQIDGGQSTHHKWLEVLRSLRHLHGGTKPKASSIAWKREAWKEAALDDLPWKDERGPSSVKHWNRFKGNVGENL